MNDFAKSIESNGFAIAEDVIDSSSVEELRTAMTCLPETEEVRRKTGVFGIRNLLELCPATRGLAASSAIRAFVEPILGAESFAVRATFFDKVPDANWNLRYHQDTVISVKERKDVDGYYSWAMKGTVQQVRPPIDVLRNMLAIRVHLDDCNENNGALRVLAGTHQQKWERDDIANCRKRFDEVTTEVRLGGILAMRPLVLHASSASQTPAHRRVIHLEYASGDLPGGLEWGRRVV